MSQAKVDQYKKEKANRKETMAKEKRQKLIMKLCSGAVLLVILAWVGISTVDFVVDSRPKKTVYVETTEIDNYLNGLYEEDAAQQ